MAAKSKPNEITITRIYDASVKHVWDAWTDPEKAAKWWGPRGHSIKTHSKDLKVGGRWKYTMFGPEGQTWENVTIYHEVEKHTRLVYDHGGNEDVDRDPLFRVTVTFNEKNGKTTMVMTMALKTAEEAQQTKKFIKQVGGNSTWDRLAEYLEQEESGTQKFYLNRTFETSIETMFDMWTKPEHLSQWLPPTGLNMEYKTSQIKEGSTTVYRMSNNTGFEIRGKIKYLKIQRPDLIIYTQQFCDENENVIRHPMAPVWPESMLTTVNLNSEGPNETRVTIMWEVDGKATQQEIDAFVKEKPGMSQGWTGSFDKLEELLK